MTALRGAFERRSFIGYEPTVAATVPFPVTVGDVTGTYGWGPGMIWRGGGTMSTDQAMRLTAVFACIRILSENIATLPIDTFTRANGVRKPFRPRPTYLNFGEPGLSRIDYFSQVMLSLLTDGNAYVLTIRDRTGTVVGLVVLDPSMVAVSREKGRLVYRVGGQVVDTVNDIMHIKSMCLPGQLVGLSPIAYAAETAGLGLAAQRFGKKFFDNGAHASLVIETPAGATVADGAAQRAGEVWNQDHQGVENAHKVGVLSGGAHLNKISVNPNEAQFLETRQFTVPDVARIFGVPPHLIADASNSTSWGSGLAEQNSAFGQLSLRPWIERIEEAHDRLLTTDGLVDVFMKFNMDAVLRASFKERMEGYQIAIDAEVMVPNEARKQEDWAPVPWGDVPPPTVRREAVGPADSNVEPSTGKVKPEAPVPAGGVK